MHYLTFEMSRLCTSLKSFASNFLDHMDQFLNEMDMSECVVHPKKPPAMAILYFFPMMKITCGHIGHRIDLHCFARLAGRLFGPGDEGEGWWDDKCVFHPIVVYDSASSVWRMYYYGRNSDSWHSGVTPALLSTGRVGLALSEDGVHWKRAKGALPEGAILDPDDEGSTSSFDSVHVACGDVFFLNGMAMAEPSVVAYFNYPIPFIPSNAPL